MAGLLAVLVSVLDHASLAWEFSTKPDLTDGLMQLVKVAGLPRLSVFFLPMRQFSFRYPCFIVSNNDYSLELRYLRFVLNFLIRLPLPYNLIALD
jgi:hypothetical protein